MNATNVREHIIVLHVTELDKAETPAAEKSACCGHYMVGSCSYPFHVQTQMCCLSARAGGCHARQQCEHADTELAQELPDIRVQEGGYKEGRAEVHTMGSL